jgi:hypothetical protein
MRAKEVTEYFGIPLYPGICGSDYDLRALYELVDIDSINTRYDVAFANYCDWLQLNGLKYLHGQSTLREIVVNKLRTVMAAAKRRISLR